LCYEKKYFRIKELIEEWVKNSNLKYNLTVILFLKGANMDIEKLKETLKANGIEEDKIDKIIADLAEEDEPDQEGDEVVEENQVDGKTEEVVPPAPSDEVEPVEVPVEPVEGNPNEEGDVPQEGEVPPVPPVDGELPVDEVQPTDVPPTDEVPPVPPFDPTELLGKIDELTGKLGEYEKTIEGLVKRTESLEEALKTAGVLETSDNENNVGIDEPRIPGSSSVGADSAFTSALAKLNKKY
jgi:hypothetical protein